MNISEKSKALKEKAIDLLEKFLMSHLSSDNSLDQKCGFLLSYWIVDYLKLLRQEKHVHKFRTYKRGDIVNVHLGYRIGSEEGGLHYGVVLNRRDSPMNPVLTIIPLTSLKSAEQVKILKPGSVFLGSELLLLLSEKLKTSPGKALVKEITKLKWGSIALTNQIVTISKLRIYDPVSNSSPLHSIRFGSESLDAIDNEIRKLFLNA